MTMIGPRLSPGVGYALLSATLFGASTPVAKAFLADNDPWLVAALLYLGSGIGLSICVAGWRATGRKGAQAPLRLPDLPVLVLVVLSGGLAGPLLFMLGLSQMGAAPASLLLNAESLGTLAIAWIVFRENVDMRLFIGAMSILAGAILLSWDGASVGLGAGAMFVFGACLAWAIDNNLTRKLSSADPVQIAMIKGLVAGITNLALAVSRGATLPELGVAIEIGLVGFVGYGVSLVFFILALRFLGTARTGAYFALAPFLGAVLAIVLLDEPMTWRLAAAGMLMGMGLWLHLAERHQHSHSHEDLYHEHVHVHDDHHQHDHLTGDPTGEPHSHSHRHSPLMHSHAHYPDLHHRHGHAHTHES